MPDPNFKGTHKHLEKKIRLFNKSFEIIPLLIIHGNFLLKPPPVKTSLRFGIFL